MNKDSKSQRPNAEVSTNPPPFYVPMTAPDEDATEGYIPLERVDEAKKAGFHFGHKTVEEKSHGQKNAF